VRRTRVALLAHAVTDEGPMAGGMERACVELVRRGLGEFEFVIVADELAPDLRGSVEWRRVRLPRRPSLLRVITFAARGGLALRSVDADVRHSVGAIVPNRVDLATVHHCHRGFQARTGRRAPRGAPPLRRANTAVHRLVAQSGERWVYRPTRVRRLAAVSAGVAEELREHFPAVDVALTPNGVDVDRFRPDGVARAQLRAEHGVADDGLVALFVGGDWAHKGVGLAADAVERLRKGGVPLELWVVGEGDPRGYARDGVRFFGVRGDVERFYAAADMFVLPSEYETFSLAAYEAAATGVPVVATSVSGITELVAAGGGVVVDRTAASVADGLGRLAGDAALRRALGDGARAWATRFGWDASAESTFELYRQLAGAAGGAR
jgi:UDP-glucose:(heptosyl)LPS alpha-1,3-glucosyltransferase